MQHVCKQFHHPMIKNDKQRQARQNYVHPTPGTDNQTGPLLLLQRLYQACSSDERLVSALKISLLASLKRRQTVGHVTRPLKRLQTKGLGLFRLARAQSLAGRFQVQDSFTPSPRTSST